MSSETQPSAFEQVTREKVTQVEERLVDALGRFDANVEDLWKVIDEFRRDLKDRVPVWVVWVMTVQGTMIGAMATWILQQLLKGGAHE